MITKVAGIRNKVLPSRFKTCWYIPERKPLKAIESHFTVDTLSDLWRPPGPGKWLVHKGASCQAWHKFNARSHRAEGKNWYLQVVLCPPHIHVHNSLTKPINVFYSRGGNIICQTICSKIESKRSKNLLLSQAFPSQNSLVSATAVLSVPVLSGHLCWHAIWSDWSEQSCHHPQDTFTQQLLATDSP